ncbi:hypothetical protein NL352_25680, partial [Klebsiella pneumoniae]|nr:hypothetical protein [Klebsiella pneumoniae]MCP6710774.1 hypothetical protein [Klebsiella pneumoniae]
GYRQTNQKTDTGKTLTRWPVFVDHFTQYGHLTEFADGLNFSPTKAMMTPAIVTNPPNIM